MDVGQPCSSGYAVPISLTGEGLRPRSLTEPAQGRTRPGPRSSLRVSLSRTPALSLGLPSPFPPQIKPRFKDAAASVTCRSSRLGHVPGNPSGLVSLRTNPRGRDGEVLGLALPGQGAGLRPEERKQGPPLTADSVIRVNLAHSRDPTSRGRLQDPQCTGQGRVNRELVGTRAALASSF